MKSGKILSVFPKIIQNMENLKTLRQAQGDIKEPFVSLSLSKTFY